MNQGHSEDRIGAISAISGAVLLAFGTYLHPLQADPNDASRAFAEYAADHLWVASHLTQFLGVVLMVGALVLLSRSMANGPAAHWAHLGIAGAIASLAMTSALQAVDGVALKVMVDTWAGAPENEKSMLFQGAFAVRQIEIGLASLMTLLFGVTVMIYGIALVVDRSFPTWLGVLGIAGGVPLLVAGTVMAHTGFSEVAMAVSMPSSILLLAWIISVGIFMWPCPPIAGASRTE
jgi:hypothetical protein